MQFTTEQWKHALHQEARRKKVGLVLTFTLISVSMLVLGLQIPKRYESTTTIQIGEESIIEPLMEGTAVSTGVAGHRRNAREILHSRRVLEEVLTTVGLQLDQMTPVEVEMWIKDVSERLRLEARGADLLRISYTDRDPELAFKGTKRFAELFIHESVESKRSESREAFEFIDTQVQQYHKTLMDAELRLKEFRESSVDARPGSQSDVDQHVSQLRQQIGSTEMELSEEREREREIRRQLAEEETFSVRLGREQQIRSRIVELQSERENLLLNYYEAHPDVLRLSYQIEELEATLQAEVERRKVSQAVGEGNSQMVQRSPLYQELRRQLVDTHTRIAILSARMIHAQKNLDAEMDRGVRVANSEAELAELTRDYEVNRNIYGDLLRNRENARVSMNLDEEGYGLVFNIIEPAMMPASPTGLRFMHFAIAGLLVGISVPLAFIALLIQMDPRIRSQETIQQDLRLRVLATVPTLYTPAQAVWNRFIAVLLVAFVLAVFVAYGYIGYIKYAQGVLTLPL